jgi:hypothetical protein
MSSGEGPQPEIPADRPAYHPAPPTVTAVVENYDNTGQVLIKITQDKAELILGDWQKRLERRFVWTIPVATAISIATSLMTATFNRELFGIPGSTWEGALKLTLYGCIVWSIVEFVLMVFRQELSIDRILHEMKTGRAPRKIPVLKRFGNWIK